MEAIISQVDQNYSAYKTRQGVSKSEIVTTL